MAHDTRAEGDARLAREARELAHDLHNLLNPLTLQIALLQRRLVDDAATQEVLEAMRQAVTRAAAEVNRLRMLGQETEPDE